MHQIKKRMVAPKQKEQGVMKLFGRKAKKGLQITAEDREWVEENFLWLVKVFGYPSWDQMNVNENFFPQTYSGREFKIENIVADCCSHYNLDKDRFTYKITEDIRDSGNIPYTFDDRPVDCFINFDGDIGRYEIHVAKDILRHPKRFLKSICYEFSKVRLMESKVKYEAGTDTHLFIYLAAVYFGYGAIISQNLIDIGVKMEAMWETKWAYVSDFPYPVMAYALAAFARIKNDLNPIWKEQLPNEMRAEFDLAVEHIISLNTELFDDKKISNNALISKLFEQADQLYVANEIEGAMAILHRIFPLADNKVIKADVYNSIGYYKLGSGDYEGSISDFLKAIELDRNYGYALDNLGFTLIMTNELEKGKEYIEKAINTHNNDMAYTNRNLALYFHKKGDYESAEKYFNMAFERQSKVDLLHFFYGCFLLDKGEKEKGVDYIRKSADCGEREAIEFLDKFRSI